MTNNEQYEIATFAAGCFWGVQDYFDQVPGVINTEVGYTGGHTKNPSYEDVCTDKTGHAEAIEITYDPEKADYNILLKHLFKMHDPTQYMRQGPDTGSQYRSAIFYHSDEQKEMAEKYIDFLNGTSAYDTEIVTQIEEAGEFYKAEEYHQKYTQKTGLGGCHIKYGPLS